MPRPELPVAFPCTQTHGLLLSGACPWCGSLVRPSAEGGRTWDLQRVRSALVGDTTTANLAIMALTRVPLHGRELSEILPLLFSVLNEREDTCLFVSAKLARQGST